MDLKAIGVFGFLDGLTAARTLEFARKVEALRYSTLWIVESGVGRDAIGTRQLSAWWNDQANRQLGRYGE